ncbi:5-methylcytosine restriction system component-like protein [Methanocaldococcus sp. FS406-22]|uniref:McrC family protein n=1 Tax=Methanocaldococcus sp. (strain FS406-22) TaxID=644281 RepID=UPI0001BF4BDD|nr:restriction endonuclease [Methanocaldococcus sp. FS406-22]ADC69222.1 5-methylcytosine restriction system component-like protein [Methanocaldococcus sp. FS406-22]
MTNLITFYEHQLIKFGDKELSKLNLGENEIIELFKTINSRNTLVEDVEDKEFDSIFRIYPNGIKAKQYVGFVAVDNKVIQVLPKVFQYCNYENKDKILAFIKMMNFAYDLNIKEQELAKVKDIASTPVIYEIFIYLFAYSLLNEIKRGFYKSYIKVREEKKFLKGKLLIDKQIRKLPHQRHKFSIEYHEFTENNLLNQIFYYTTYISLKKTKWRENKKLLSELMLIFEGINLRKITIHDFKRVHFTRLNERFKKPFNLAKIILSAFGEIDGEDAIGFFVDMNDLFEKFICSILSKSLGFEIKYQSKFKLFKEVKGIKNIEQKPDYVVYKDNKPVLVLDAKYTEINREYEKPKLPSDMLRQIYTYAKYYTLKCNYKIRSVLIFPKSKKYNDFNSKAIIGEATFFDNEINLYVLTYNLKKLIEGDGIDEEFINCIKKLTENKGEGLE